MSYHQPIVCLIECNRYPRPKKALINLYNFQQRISWLSHRWRTQRNAISNVNCRIQWIIESLNAPCAPWYSEEHACLSVIKFSTPRVSRPFGDWTWRCWPHIGRLLSNASAEFNLWLPDVSVIIMLRCRLIPQSPLIMVFGQNHHQIWPQIR